MKNVRETNIQSTIQIVNYQKKEKNVFQVVN